MTRRIGLLGGAFNPPHLGHLKLAEIALNELALDEVRFVPTAVSPHKPTEGPDGATRLRLLEDVLRAAALPFVAEPIELGRPGPSYTVDTLEELQRREPGNAWIFLLGTDQAATFPDWRQPERILELASLAVTHRPGHPALLPPVLSERLREYWSGAAGEVVWIPGTELFLSSTQLRDQLSKGLQPEGLPHELGAAILREKLYR